MQAKRLCAGAYGSTKRYKSVERIFKVNAKCIVGASGEISDFQQLQTKLMTLESEAEMKETQIKQMQTESEKSIDELQMRVQTQEQYINDLERRRELAKKEIEDLNSKVLKQRGIIQLGQER